MNPHRHHTWNNNHSQNSHRPQSPDNSNSSSSGNKKSRGRKVKKSESESGISKLLKTLRKDSSGKKAAEKLRSRERSGSSSTLDGRSRPQRRGSLDRSPARKRASSPDRRRAKSMDRRAERAQWDRTPERPCDDGGFLAATPERRLYERRLLKDSSGRVVGAATPERGGGNNGAAASLPRGRAYDGAAKNGNLLRDSSSERREERHHVNGTPERRYRVERDSSPDSTYSRDELSYAAAAAAGPRLKDYYSMMKNNAAYNNAGHKNNAVGRSPNQLPEPKRRLYKESPKDLSI